MDMEAMDMEDMESTKYDLLFLDNALGEKSKREIWVTDLHLKILIRIFFYPGSPS